MLSVMMSFRWLGQSCLCSQCQDFDVFVWIFRGRKVFPWLRIFGLCWPDNLTGGVFLNLGNDSIFWSRVRSVHSGTSVRSITWMINEQMKMEKPVSKLPWMLEVYDETVPGTRELSFLPSDSGVTCIVARNSSLRHSLVKRVDSGVFNPNNILGAFGVKGAQSTELAKGGSNRGKVGHFDLEHGQMRHMTDMVVQEEVEIALDELVVRVECNVLGLPEP